MRLKPHIAKNTAPHDPLTTVLIIAAVCIFAIYFIMPLYIMVVNSFKPFEEIQNGTIFNLPMLWTLEPWREAWSGTKIGVQREGLKPYFVNSLLIAAPSVIISTALGSLNGYILSKWRFRASELLFTLLLLTCFIPYQVILIPMAHMLGFLGLSQSVWGLILVHIVYGLGISTLFFRKYFQTIPQEIVSAARIDGAGFITIFYRIFVPLSGPMIVVSIVWQFTAVWNDFLFGSTFASAASIPVTVALNNLVAASTSVKAYNVHLAASLITAIPTLIIYALCGRLFLRGLMFSMVKG